MLADDVVVVLRFLLDGRDVQELVALCDQLADALWPHMEADYAHKSFTATLHRLRRLLDDDDAVLLALAGHPVRWRVLRELAASDRQVGELTAAVGEPQNLVSYHLRLLRDGGLVTARRSSADGRDHYYAIDLAA